MCLLLLLWIAQSRSGPWDLRTRTSLWKDTRRESTALREFSFVVSFRFLIMSGKSYYGGGDKPYLISGGDDFLVKVWDYQNKKCIQSMEGEKAKVNCFVVNLFLFCRTYQQCDCRWISSFSSCDCDCKKRKRGC